MSRLDDCLQRAIDAGELDEGRGRAAQVRYREVLARYAEAGLTEVDARAAANLDVAQVMIDELRATRHTKLRQAELMARNEGRYATAHADNPDLILRDVEHAQYEGAALQQDFMASISHFLAAFKTDVIGRVRNKAYLQDVTREMHGQATGNVAAAELAAAVRAVQERARVLFNSLGGNIGKLDDFGIPHRHSAAKVAADKDGWKQAIYDSADWHRMIDHRTGKPFSPVKGAKPFRDTVEDFLEDVHSAITSDGWDDRFPSLAMGGTGMAARRAEHRVLHFRDGDAWIAYNEAFGEANPFDAVVSHLSGMARDIALMRTFGPNPKAGLAHAGQVMERAARLATDLDGKAHAKRVERVRSKIEKSRVLLATLTGEANRPADAGWARFFAGTRNLLTAAQLGSAPLSAVTDWSSMANAARAVGLNPGSTWNRSMQTILRGITPEQARDMGYIFDTWFDTGAAHARFMGDIWAPEITSRITNTVLRVNGLAFLTDRTRFGVAMAFGSDLAQQAAKGFDDLDAPLRTFMDSRGIGPREWDALRDPRAIYTDPTGGRHINAQWFRQHTDLAEDEAADIAIRWGALVRQFQELAIPTASLRGRAAIVSEARAGSAGGELLRSVAMYKSFVMSLMFNQIRLVQELPGTNWTRAGYVAAYMASMTAMGALAVQLKELAKGRDPRDMTEGRFWGAAFMQGGGVGIFGDFFSATASRTGGGLAEVASGPVVGVAGDALRMISSNAERAAEGKDILLGRDLASFARRYTPGSTIWYSRLAMDRMVWDQLQHLLDPEAEDLWRRQEGNQRRNFGNASWWQRGTSAPQRGPDFSQIGGN